MLLPIRILGDPVLREPAKPVESFDRALRRLAKDQISPSIATTRRRSRSYPIRRRPEADQAFTERFATRLSEP